MGEEQEGWVKVRRLTTAGEETREEGYIPASYTQPLSTL